MEDFNIFPGEEGEEDVSEGEGSNRAFIIIMGALAGLLALIICVFVVWFMVLRPNAQNPIEATNQAVEATNQAVEATSTAVAIAQAATATAQAQPTATDTPEPTDTPLPTDTPTPTLAPNTPEPPATPVDLAEVTPTTSGATATRRAGPTPTDSDDKDDKGVPDTGLGVLGVVVLAFGLLFLLILVRRMRRAA